MRARTAAMMVIGVAMAVVAYAAPYETLSSVRPAELIKTFNAESDHARLLVLLSPT